MTEFKETLCRLCLKSIIDKNFGIIDSHTRDILVDGLLLKLKFNVESQEVICNWCQRALTTAIEFKSMCLNTDNMIIPHVDYEKMLQVDIREVYIKENGRSHVTDISYNDKICRLCMQLIKGEIRGIGEQELEAIQKFAPEMNIMIIKDPVVCKSCFDSLCTHNNFLKDCLEVDQRITDIFESSSKDSKIYALSSDLLIKTEDLESEDFEMNEMEMAVKTECVDIKTEVDGSDMLRSNYETFENIDYKCPENQGPKLMRNHNNRSIEKCSTKAIKDSFTLDQFKGNPLYKCDKCIYETKSMIRFTRHCKKHKNVVDVYKCETCEYETKQKRLLKYHRLKHKDPSEIQIYKCDACDYQSRYKKNVRKHKLMHKDRSEIRIYKCNTCDFQSRHKNSFTKHQFIHKNLSEIQIYKCDGCDYQSRYKKYVKRHQLIHKDPSEIQIYKCDACDFQSRHKNSFMMHQLIHKNPSELHIYKCDTCNYESRHKKYVMRHQLKHKDSSELQIYRCNDCHFKTKYKCDLKRHVIKHRDVQV